MIAIVEVYSISKILIYKEVNIMTKLVNTLRKIYNVKNLNVYKEDTAKGRYCRIVYKVFTISSIAVFAMLLTALIYNIINVLL